VIYVAPGRTRTLHAGDRGADIADGRGRKLTDVEWHTFGEWATWPGRWGNSTGAGQSPESPGCQGERWHAPHMFHAAVASAPGRMFRARPGTAPTMSVWIRGGASSSA
jgi:hypothetical protein